MNRLLYLCSGILLALAPQYAAAQPTADAQTLVRLTSAEPLKLIRDADSPLLIAQCTINGKACRMLLDTAASHTIFDAAFIKKNFPGMPLVDVQTTADSNVNSGLKYFALKNFTVGGLNIANYEALSMDLTGLKQSFKGGIDGILGINYLKFCPFFFSAKNATLHFLPRAVVDKMTKKELYATRTDTGIYNIRCQLGEESFSLLLDSGATATKAASAIGKWQTDDTKAFQAPVTGINGTAMVTIKPGVPATLKLGPDFTLHHQAWLVDCSDGLSILGIDTLMQFDIVVDDPKQKVYVIPPRIKK